MMLMVFSKICLFLFLKLKTLSNPTKTRITHPTFITGILSETITSCAVTNRKTAAKTAKKVQIVCILCSMEYKFQAKVA